MWCVSPGASPPVTEIPSSRQQGVVGPGAPPPVIKIPSSRREVQVCFPCLRFTYWLWRYRLPDGGLCVLVRGFHPRLLRYLLPDGLFFSTISVKNRVWEICVRNIAQAVLFRIVTLPDLSVARERLRSVRF